MRRFAPLALFATATALAACTDVSTDPATPWAIAFDTLPAPSVVEGDTMRDTLGVATPLRAQVFNLRGEPLADAPVSFIATTRGAALRTANDVLPNGYVIARPDTLADQVQIVAQVANLQSVARAVDVVRAPTLLRVEGSTSLDLLYRAGVDTSSATLRVRVGFDSSGTVVGVKSWLVRYTIVYPAGAAADTGAAAFIVTDSTSLRRERIDTTGTDGLASRAVRIRPGKLANATDSVVVEARATYKTELLGSPARFVVHYAPRP